jgi:hypothetical protein
MYSTFHFSLTNCHHIPIEIRNLVLVIAANAGCRVLLEDFAKTFQRAHQLKNQKACTDNLSNASTTEILTHSETCSGLTKQLLEAKIVWKTAKPTGNANPSILFKSLSERLHRCMLQGPGNVMWVPDDLPPIENKWMLRYLKNLSV